MFEGFEIPKQKEFTVELTRPTVTEAEEGQDAPIPEYGQDASTETFKLDILNQKYLEVDYAEIKKSENKEYLADLFGSDYNWPGKVDEYIN